jgi:hypothetical protein
MADKVEAETENKISTANGCEGNCGEHHHSNDAR